MGFRFSRRIGILPGLKLNFSGSGVSLSAGVRGAHLNFGSRGTYASVGLPGTGLSYRQRIGGGVNRSAPSQLTPEQIRSIGNRQNDHLAMQLAGSGTQNVGLSPEEARRYVADPRFRLMDPDTGLRLTPIRLEAKIKANDLKEKLENLQIKLQTEAEEYQHLLNFWKPLPAIPTTEDWTNELKKRVFESRIPIPVAPDMQAEQAKLLNELTAKEHTGINKFLPGFVARSDAKTDFTTAWPAREAELQLAYDTQVQQYQQQVATEQAEWDAAETKRIEWIQRLLDGNLEEIDHTVAEVLAGLQLPFHTHCDYFGDDEHTVSLHLELPTQEEVIPETSKSILKTGDTKDVRRTESERAMDYTRLAMGVVVFMAAELASYLPTVQAFRVAAFTHRPRVREADPENSCVLDVTVQRSALIEFGEEDNLTAFMTRQGGRFHVNALGGLDGVPVPSWLEHQDYQDRRG